MYQVAGFGRGSTQLEDLERLPVDWERKKIEDLERLPVDWERKKIEDLGRLPVDSTFKKIHSFLQLLYL